MKTIKGRNAEILTTVEELVELDKMAVTLARYIQVKRQEAVMSYENTKDYE